MSLRIFLATESERELIRGVIEEHDLGIIIGEKAFGQTGQVIDQYQPDVMIFDQPWIVKLDMPCQVVKPLRIFILPARNQEMITAAYRAGIDYCVSLPINKAEIVALVKRLQESRRFQQIQQLFLKNAKNDCPEKEKDGEYPAASHDRSRDAIYRFLVDFGVVKQSEFFYLYQVAAKIKPYMQRQDHYYRLKEIYQQVARMCNQNPGLVEQRIRRAVMKVQNHLARLLITEEDLSKPQKYGAILFEWDELKQECRWHTGESQYRGRVNVRKFMEGLLYLTGEEYKVA